MELHQKPAFRSSEQEEFCTGGRIFKDKLTKDSSEDFILPDYLPDIKKVVAVFPTALIKNRFIGSGTLEYEGDVTYRILYISDDGSFRSATFLTGFEEKIGNENITENAVEILKPKSENVNVRLLNPRKVNIRSSNGAEVEIYERKNYRPELYGARTVEDENNLETKCLIFPSCNVMNLRENGLTLSEDLNFEAVMPTAKEIVMGRAVLMAEECHISEGEVQIRGNADLSILLSVESKGEKEEWMLMNRQVPFSQTIKNKDFHEKGEGTVHLLPEGVEFRLRNDEFGQKRVIEFDMTYQADVTVFYNKEVALCVDAYSVERKAETEQSEKELYFLSKAVKGGFSVNETVKADLPEEGGYTLLGCYPFPSLYLSKDIEEEGGKAVLEGECAFALLLKDSAGTPDMRRVTVPMKLKSDHLILKDSQGEVCCKITGLRCRLDRNEVSFDFETVYSMTVLTKTKETSLDSIRLLKENRASDCGKGSMVIYYPDEGEELFDIAKKYGVKKEEIEKENKERERKKPLFIPMRH